MLDVVSGAAHRRVTIETEIRHEGLDPEMPLSLDYGCPACSAKTALPWPVCSLSTLLAMPECLHELVGPREQGLEPWLLLEKPTISSSGVKLKYSVTAL